ncbi:Crp/Fnr family transcriptional regulator [Labilibaculum antarcticum]|uniref:Crp/Fnr family transcriptional regulator n=1 Tax=Labilibaculum antarcticum TaxID=1717717 RepID=A0A1Y1CDL0_9BACT|nr:Crp/Fnr family transcriptional regulator [Labilibaculum antarcticum]BAX78424.1 Crp/Fnr family transcriptional regulator [Labilibaculum antarcticum]
MSVINTCADCEIASKCFKKLIPSELEFINQMKIQIQYRKGEILCKQGAFASYVLYIPNGLVKLYLENTNNKFTNIKILKSMNFIGLASIYGENIYNYSVVALKETDVCLIDKDAIRKLLESNSDFASELIKQYCVREKYFLNFIKSISYKQIPGRLADTLLNLCSEEFKDENIFNYITRKDIADFACISKESTIKLLSEFKKEGIISSNGKIIEILKPDKLKEISRFG